MQIRIGFDIAITVQGPVPGLLALWPHPDEAHRIAGPALRADPAVPIALHRDLHGNIRGRLIFPEGETRLRWEGLATDDRQPDPVVPDAVQHPVEDLPDEVLPYLMPSRYCESDLLAAEAWERFGAVRGGWARAQAICDHVHQAIRFDYRAASPGRSAASSRREGTGVCRDYAHLVLAYARALTIPARYVTGWLGDIDWPDQGPGDFCAWTELYLGGRWYPFDARYNAPRIGRIVMARGRDAADVPFLTTFGASTLSHFAVTCEEVTLPAASASAARQGSSAGPLSHPPPPVPGG